MNTMQFPINAHCVVQMNDAVYALGRSSRNGTLQLIVRGNSTGFHGEQQGDALICPLDAENARTLQERLPWLRPQPLGNRLSFGFGDRIGLATPGHVDALRSADPTGRIAPIFAQQSVRENQRLNRTPQEVMTAAVWSLFAENWRLPWGADADHDATECIA